jgi:hypothetical protein
VKVYNFLEETHEACLAGFSFANDDEFLSIADMSTVVIDLCEVLGNGMEPLFGSG